MEENRKINFFTRIKIAIFKLEDYGIFLGERFSVAIKYFFLLIFIMSVASSLIDTYDFSKMTNRAYQYITNELPEFSYENEKMSFDNIVEAYDEEYDFRLYIDTSETVNEETLTNYKNKIYDAKFGLIALKDKVIYITNGAEIEYSYAQLLETYSLEIHNKSDVLQILTSVSAGSILGIFFIMNLVAVYISNIIAIFGDLMIVALFGYVAARFCGIRFKLIPIFSLAIYALSLSIVLAGIYSIVYTLTGFVINYFSVMYLLIAYVYIIAAIMMIKYDLIKQHLEIEKIMQVQKQVHETLEEQEKEKEEKEDEKENKEEKPNEQEKKEKPSLDNEPEINREPDGSEI